MDVVWITFMRSDQLLDLPFTSQETHWMRAPMQSIPRFADAIAHFPRCNARGDLGEANRHASSRGGIPRHVPARPGRSGIHSDRADSAQAPSSTSRNSRRTLTIPRGGGPSYLPRAPRGTRQGFMAATSATVRVARPALPSDPRSPIALFVLVAARWRNSQACSHRKVLRWNTIGSTSDCTRTSLIFNSTTA
jgi:hypothetical protein